MIKSRIISIEDASAGDVNANLLINAIGFETRAMFATKFSSVHADHYLSLAFPVVDLFSYRENLNEMKRRNSKILFDPLIEFSSPDVAAWLDGKFKNQNFSVAVDISSMNRSMIAACIMFLAYNRAKISQATLLYAPQTYTDPGSDFPRLERLGPGLPELGGHDADAGLPIGLLISVGYEYGVAVGLINKVEPQLTICLHGTGRDPRFETAVREANLNFDFGIGNVQLAKYNLNNPAAAFSYIDHLMYGMIDRYRVLAIPLGPKLIAALLALLSVRYFGKVAYWRVVEERAQYKNAFPGNDIIAIELDLLQIIPQESYQSLRETSMFKMSSRAHSL